VEEYAMDQAAGRERGWIDEKKGVRNLTSIKRAGVDFIWSIAGGRSQWIT